jgi:hypothetical protein
MITEKNEGRVTMLMGNDDGRALPSGALRPHKASLPITMFGHRINNH